MTNGGGYCRHIPVSSALVAAVDVGVAHKGFADEEGLDPMPGEALAVGVVADAALGDHDPARRDQRLQPLADFERGLEGAQIAIVDADQAAFERERPLELGLVWVSISTSRLKSWAALLSVLAVSSSTAAMMIRMQSAPQARASAT